MTRAIRPLVLATVIAAAGSMLIAHTAPALGTPAEQATGRKEVTLGAASSGFVVKVVSEHDAVFGAGLRCPTVNYPGPDDSGVSPVGFEYGNTCATLYQASVHFDLSELDGQKIQRVERAVLRYSEAIQTRHDFDLNSLTCVRDIRVALPGQAANGLLNYFPAFLTRRVGDGPADPWLVTETVQRWLDGRFENHGFVLIGFDESANPDSNPWACLSWLFNFELDLVLQLEVPVADVLRRDVLSAQPTATPLPFETRVGDSALVRQVLPDLVVSNIYMKKYDPTKPLNCDRGANTFVAAIKNIGTGDAGAFLAELKVATTSTGQIQTFNQVVAGLKSNAEILVEFPALTLGEGPHTVQVTVDASGQIGELDDARNSREASCTT